MICKHAKISQRRQCELLEVNRSSFYYKGKAERTENLNMMSLIDEIHLKHPTFGVLRIQDQLEELGHRINVK